MSFDVESHVNRTLFTSMKNCKQCSYVNHDQIYPGIYRPGQKYFFVGAAPWNLAGPEEAFRVSHAAANFEKFISAVGIKREECFTTNAVVHIPIQRSGRSRQPQPEEIHNCSRYLHEQIHVLNPKLIILLGSVALQSINFIQNTGVYSITKLIRNPVAWKGRWLIGCTHPSPMAVSFRGEQEQIQDYEYVKRFYDTL